MKIVKADLGSHQPELGVHPPSFASLPSVQNPFPAPSAFPQVPQGRELTEP